MRHHALAILQYLRRMTIRRTATDVGSSQIAGIDEANKLRSLVVEQCVGTHRIRGRWPGFRKARLYVSLLLGLGGRIAAVAINAAEMDRILEVRILDVLMTGNA